MLTLSSIVLILGLASYLGKETTITIHSDKCCDKSIHWIWCEPNTTGPDKSGFSAEQYDIHSVLSKVNQSVQELHDVPYAQRKGTRYPE